MQIEVKFSIGQDVEHFTRVKGRITAIFHRGGRNAYEMSYLNDTGNPTCITCEECELTEILNDAIGFRK